MMSFCWEWFDYSTCLFLDILPSTSLSLLSPLPPHQSIALWKWHFERLIALWPSLRASDRWLAESGVEVLHVPCISRHGSWSRHTRWRRFLICWPPRDSPIPVDRKQIIHGILQHFCCSQTIRGRIILVEERQVAFYRWMDKYCKHTDRKQWKDSWKFVVPEMHCLITQDSVYG